MITIFMVVIERTLNNFKINVVFGEIVRMGEGIEPLMTGPALMQSPTMSTSHITF